MAGVWNQSARRGGNHQFHLIFVAAACFFAIILEICFATGVALAGKSPFTGGFPPARPPQAKTDLSKLSPATRTLLRMMLQAEHHLALSGEQTTILYKLNGKAAQSTQTVFRDSNNGYRYEYHSPDRLRGELVVSSHGTTWHYIPKKKQIIVSSGRQRSFMTQIGPAFNALSKGSAQASVVGNDTIAGRSTKIVVIKGVGSNPSGSIKLWIDTVTGAQLRTDLYDAAGNLQSTSYFTSISYSPLFPMGTFNEPIVPVDTQFVNPGHETPLVRLPTDAVAGFHVMKPEYLPLGYVFKSASLFLFQGHSAVHLQYASALSILSIFERPYDTDVVGHVDEVRSPRSGTVIVTEKDVEFVGIGTLSNDETTRVLKSMR